MTENKDTWAAYRQLALRLDEEISKLEGTKLPLSDSEKKILKTLKNVLGNFASKGENNDDNE